MLFAITGRIKELRSKAFANSSTYILQWVQDENKSSLLNFKGYEGTGIQRLKYDQNKPFAKEVVYKNYSKPSKEVKIPKA